MTSPDTELILHGEHPTLRNYERVDGGPWHDGFLMDLLADELTA